MVTHWKNEIYKSVHKLNLTTNLAIDSIEPTSHSVALKHPLCKAMSEEFDTLIRNGTLYFVSTLQSQNIVGNKWMNRNKHKPNGLIDCSEAHLVDKGFHHQPGVDYHKTFTLLVNSSV